VSKYFYRGNRDPFDYTDEIVLETDAQGNVTRSLFRGGNSAEIADSQYSAIKDRFVLEPDEVSPPAVTDSIKKEEEVSK